MEENMKNQKVALLFGYSESAGQVVLEGLLRAGYSVAITSRSEEKLNKAISAMPNFSGRIKPFIVNVQDLGSYSALLSEVEKSFGGQITAVYHSVAIYSLAYDASPSEIQSSITVNIGSIWALFGAALSLWQEREGTHNFLFAGGTFADNGAWSVSSSSQFISATKAFVKNFTESANATFNDKDLHIANIQIGDVVYTEETIPEEKREDVLTFREDVRSTIISVLEERRPAWKSTYQVLPAQPPWYKLED